MLNRSQKFYIHKIITIIHLTFISHYKDDLFVLKNKLFLNILKLYCFYKKTL